MSTSAVPYAGYETTFITKVEMTDDARKALITKVEQLVGSFDGEVLCQDDWGKIRLSYPIEKESKGHYTYIAYTGRPGVVAEIERTLRIQDHILRYLSVKIEDELDKAAFFKDRINYRARPDKDVQDIRR